MPDLTFPLIDGVRHDWTSTETKVAGQIFIGCKSFKTSRKRTRGLVMGAHPDPIAKTRGTNAYTASIEMPVAEWYLLKATVKALADQQGIGYGDVLFPATVTLTAPNFATRTVECFGCSLDETSSEDAQGPDPLMRKIDLNPLKIVDDGDDDTIPLQAPPGA